MIYTTDSLHDYIASFTHYLTAEEQASVVRAFHLAERAHRGQNRHSGEPYITHPVAVAAILADLRLDADALSAALLHDVIEDTKIPREEIKVLTSITVLHLVDAVSKLDHLGFASKEDAQAENFRRMLLAMTQDIRVMLIKLADRLHNMRTLGSLKVHKKRRIAQETLDIYVPIARRLGLNRVYNELHDLAFQAIHPKRYEVLQKALKAISGGNRALRIEALLSDLEAYLRANGVSATVSGQPKSLYGIYQKMRSQHMRFEQVNELFGCRVIVNDTISCYTAMGLIHQRYKPIPGKIKDYIAISKLNGYQSLHTTVFGPFQAPLEIQIRTEKMHHIAETGLAAHWRYKLENNDSSSLLAAQQAARHWLRQLLEIQSKTDSSKEFLSHVKKDLFPSEVYVFTPQGDTIALPRGASALDFAYAVHTEIGHHCHRVKINQQYKPLKTLLKNGDRIEVITSKTAIPHSIWLNWVITGRARSSIRHFLNRYPDISEKQLRANLIVGEAKYLILQGKFIDSAHWARCCSPIYGDAITGGINDRSGDSLIIHRTHCLQLKQKIKEGSFIPIPIEWSKDHHKEKFYNCRIELWTDNEPDKLAKIIHAIAHLNISIIDINLHAFENKASIHIFITVSLPNRSYLARLFKQLRNTHVVHHLQRTIS